LSEDPARNHDRLAELSESVKRLSEQVVDLAERVSRLEEENKWLREQLSEIREDIKDINRNNWAILVSALTILATVLFEITRAHLIP